MDKNENEPEKMIRDEQPVVRGSVGATDFIYPSVPNDDADSDSEGDDD